MTATVSVRVPATIANLGPGFDALGMAVSLHLEVEARHADEDSFRYEGEGSVPAGDTLIHQAYREVCRLMGREPRPLAVHARNRIPLARGLGSSSAALVAGAAVADALHGHTLGRDGVLRACARLEGHPDNVAPAVLGGFTASAGDPLVSVALPTPASWRVLVAVPHFELLTSEARAALPNEFSRADAVFNLARSALMVAAVASGRADALREACRDRLHQPYRAPLVPGLQEAIDGALEAGADAAFLSGAGPSVAAIARDDAVAGVRGALSRFAPRVFALAVAPGYEFI
ncbi:MAG TPA: homoserine kinase [Deinococcales bacterium]|nr:homoserine kinase [Deinococcales bacterium]